METSCGCAKCRPALSYSLVCDWPDEYADDCQSRFVNKRGHANIQKDGTYPVVPRMWGGVTSAAQLRGITDVVDKFAIRVHGAAVTCPPLHNWVISLETGEALGADKGTVPTVPVRIEGGRRLLALTAAADRAA